jgi:hypothetical protein
MDQKELRRIGKLLHPPQRVVVRHARYGLAASCEDNVAAAHASQRGGAGGIDRQDGEAIEGVRVGGEVEVIADHVLGGGEAKRRVYASDGDGDSGCVKQN